MCTPPGILRDPPIGRGGDSIVLGRLTLAKAGETTGSDT